MMLSKFQFKNKNLILNNQAKLGEFEKSSWLNRLMVIWLAGTSILLPNKMFPFPYNIEIVDIWILGGMPVVLFFILLRRPKFISFSYVVPMSLILIGSLISTFDSLSPSKSLIVVGKEVYIFVWFLIVTILLFQLNAKELRQVMRIWAVVVVFHGILMVAQFLSPEIFHFTNSFGGKPVTYENYRAAGLFVSKSAGNANKAAYFQILGFVPLLLSGFSKRTTTIMALLIFASIISTGSNGAAIAFISGLIFAIVAIAYVKRSFTILMKIFLGIIVAFIILGGVFIGISINDSDYISRFEGMGVGRFEKSADGRLGLWQRGINVLVNYDVYLWGVGPENFRFLDPAKWDNQLHNDILAFLVERGLIALLGLVLIAGVAGKKAMHMIEIFRRDNKRADLGAVVFFAAIVATLIVSLFHQIFHARELWLFLAVQEVVLFKLITSGKVLDQNIHSTSVSQDLIITV